MKCMQGLDACVDPGVYSQVMHHRRLDLIPLTQGQLKKRLLVMVDEGFYLPMKETRMMDRARGPVGFLFGTPLCNAPDIAELRKSHENVNQHDATFERKYWEVREGSKGDISRFRFGDGTHAAVQLNLFGYNAFDNTGLLFRKLGDIAVRSPKCSAI